MMLLAGGAVPVEAERVEPFVACAATVGDAERLACYDRAVEAVSADGRRIRAEREAASAAAAAAAAATAADAARAAEVSAFGRETMPASARPADGTEAASRELSATIQELLTGADGKYVFLLENGQMWRQLDGFTLPPIRAGDTVEIRRMLAGRFAMTFPRHKRTVSVRRMR
jgi:hypothetical protein